MIKNLTIGLLATASVFTISSAYANPHQWYAKAAAGYTLPDNATLDSSGNGTLQNTIFRYKRVKANGGFAGDVALGYVLWGSVNRSFLARVELAFGYKDRKFDDTNVSVENTGVGAGFGNQTNNIVNGKVQSFIGMANLFVDLFEWNRFVPFVGVGLGFSSNKTGDISVRDNTTITYVVSGRAETKLAYSLYAGTGFKMTQDLTAEVFYRYTDLGKVKTSNTWRPQANSGSLSGKLTAHDVMAAVRWSF